MVMAREVWMPGGQSPNYSRVLGIYMNKLKKEEKSC